MSNTVTIKSGEHFYKVPMHEFSTYWLNHLDRITIPQLPAEIPVISVMAAERRAELAKVGESWD